MERLLLVYTTFPDMDTGLAVGEALKELHPHETPFMLFIEPEDADGDTLSWILEHFQAKWIPVRVKKMRQNKSLEPIR